MWKCFDLCNEKMIDFEVFFSLSYRSNFDFFFIYMDEFVSFFTIARNMIDWILILDIGAFPFIYSVDSYFYFYFFPLQDLSIYTFDFVRY